VVWEAMNFRGLSLAVEEPALGAGSDAWVE
jgi:hypothetical protein